MQRTYEGRKNLGNIQPEDGARFRGHGLIKTTGRYNHARVRDSLRERLGRDVRDFEVLPELLALPDWAALSAADDWDDLGLNELADAGDFETITRKINGALNGLTDCEARWDGVKKALQLPAPDVPVEECSAPAPIADLQTLSTPSNASSMSPFIAATLPSLMDLVPKLARVLGSGSETSERNINPLRSW